MESGANVSPNVQSKVGLLTFLFLPANLPLISKFWIRLDRKRMPDYTICNVNGKPSWLIRLQCTCIALTLTLKRHE